VPLGAICRIERYLIMAEKFIEEFVCNGCERTGHATWEGEAGFERKLVDISPEFEIRPGDTGPSLVIVCGHCGTTQPEQVIRGLSPDTPGPAN
jgi:hypothetical protein